MVELLVVDLKVNILGHTIYTLSVVVIAFKIEEL